MASFLKLHRTVDERYLKGAMPVAHPGFGRRGGGGHIQRRIFLSEPGQMGRCHVPLTVWGPGVRLRSPDGVQSNALVGIGVWAPLCLGDKTESALKIMTLAQMMAHHQALAHGFSGVGV